MTMKSGDHDSAKARLRKHSMGDLGWAIVWRSHARKAGRTKSCRVESSGSARCAWICVGVHSERSQHQIIANQRTSRWAWEADGRCGRCEWRSEAGACEARICTNEEAQEAVYTAEACGYQKKDKTRSRSRRHASQGSGNERERERERRVGAELSVAVRNERGGCRT